MEHRIQLAAGIESGMTFEQFDDLCQKHGCTLEGKTIGAQRDAAGDKSNEINFV